MKNSPDEEWLHNLEKRLRDYTEEPDGDLWNEIAGKINDDREPVWILWSNRAAAFIALAALLWLWPVFHKAPPRFTSETLSQQENLSAKGDAENQSAYGNDQKPVQLKSHEPEKNTKRVDKSREETLNQNFKNKADKVRSGSVNKISDKNENPVNKELITNSDEKNTHQDEANQEELLTSSSTPAQTEAQTSNTEIFKTDSIKPLLIKGDSVKNQPKKIESKKSGRKKRRLTLYTTVTPLLTYQKVTPYKNDGIVINRFNARPVLSADRLGLNIEAGVQGKLSEKLEFYSGLSIYKQSQTLTYQYQSGDHVSVTQQAEFNYTVNPGTSAQSLRYDMLTIGGQTGILYLIRGERLKHKLGAGLSYQHGILKPGEDSYANNQSQYMFYQLFYRNEYLINSDVRIFIQPFYTHTIFSKEKLDEPFKLTPYRAGIGFGLVYQFK
jgi:hypothetical protein